MKNDASQNPEKVLNSRAKRRTRKQRRHILYDRTEYISEYRGVIYNDVIVVMHALVLKAAFEVRRLLGQLGQLENKEMSSFASCKRCKLLRFWNLDKRKKESGGRKDNKDQVRQKMRMARLQLTAFCVYCPNLRKGQNESKNMADVIHKIFPATLSAVVV